MNKASCYLSVVIIGWVPPVIAINDGNAQNQILPGESPCHYELPKHRAWGEHENWAWSKRICLGKIADMSIFGGDHSPLCDPTEIVNWPNSRNLSQEFLDTILNHKPYRDAIPRNGIHIRCARFSEPIDFSNMVIAHPLWLHESRFHRDVNFTNFQSLRGVSLLGSAFDGSLFADRLQVGGSLSLGDGHFMEVHLDNAKITGDLEAKNSVFNEQFRAERLEVGATMFLEDGQFKEINLYSAKISGNLYLSNSIFDGTFNAEGLELLGSLFMERGAIFKNFRIHGAKVSGAIKSIGSVFEGPFHADRLDVGTNLFLEKCRFEKEVRLYGARIGGNLDTVESIFEDLFNAEGIEVSGALFLKDKVRFKKVRLHSANVGLNLETDSSSFNGLFNASRIEVGGNLFMRNKAAFGDIKLNGAKIGGHLQIRDGDFNGHLDLTSATIADEFNMTSPPPRWSSTSRLTLRNANVGALNDTENAWDIESGQLDLVGFTYKQLGGFGATRESAMYSRTNNWLLAWLAKQDGFNLTYNPQPFEQLAKVLRQSGYPDKADVILLAAKNHQRDSPKTPLLTKIKLWIQWGLIGYGYYNWIALIWFFGLVWLGALTCGKCTFGRRMRWTQRFWYSIDMALPIINLNNRHDLVKLTGNVLTYFYLHKVAGFVLVSFLVAGLSGLTK